MKTVGKNIGLWLLVSLLLVPAPVLAGSPLQDISARAAAALIQENQSNPDFVILDIRTPKEYRTGHISGASNLDFYAPSFASEFRSLDRKKSYLIYCRSGNRSRQLMRAVEKMDFKKVYHLRSGLVDWVGQGFKLAPSE